MSGGGGFRAAAGWHAFLKTRGFIVDDLGRDLNIQSASNDAAADEGQRLARGDVIGTITGSARSILLVERVALNFMQRMSGIATMTALMAEKVT